MCSVSWCIDDSGYQIFFNRDEQKTRAPALAPQSFFQQETHVLMPIDPVGQGSWISLNEYGLSLCLLNNYQGTKPEGELISRGQLLKRLSSEADLAQVEAHFGTLTLEQFAPFTLLAFELENSKVRSFEWNGKQACISNAVSPHFSSAVALDNVSEYRQSVYEHEPMKNTEALLMFHSQHHPEHSHMSVCMHRDDAQTVSFTRIQVSKDSMQMNYVPGSPCTHLSPQTMAALAYRLPNTISLVS
jgi:hypothetical protein